MRSTIKDKKENIKSEDDTLFGLLSMYKIYNTYFRILAGENDKISLQITDNPKKWPKIDANQYKGYKLLKRSETGMMKLSVKYLSPEHLINHLGPSLGLKIPETDLQIPVSFVKTGYYSLETKLKYLQEVLNTINKIIDLSPKKKYEILEKSLIKET